ncbi:caspase family protein [Maribacter sp. X9]|uniref:caspase family protein n=1 Tax=Maribacter sp. X9 TaxID=3402159 RepID=UPI003AF3D29B
MSKNFILNIAINNYGNSAFPKLNNAVNDAKKFETILLENYGFETITDSLFDENATRKNIIESLNKLSTLTTNSDNLIIYFAGHGSIHPKTKKGYWIPQDAENQISDFIPNSTIVDAIYGIDAKHILLILDSCFSGSFLNQTRSQVEHHYLKLNESKSRWVITSGRDEKVSDGKPGIGSPFSVILNEFLEQNTAKTFSVSELATIVSKGTGNSSKQQPIFAHIEGVGHQDGQMIFNLANEVKLKAPVEVQTDLSKIVVPLEASKKIKKLGLSKKSIFGFYKNNDSIIVKLNDSKNDFICNAYTYEEITEYIPEFIDVDEETYIANLTNYEKLGKPEEGTFDYATVSFERTFIKDTPYMAICKCRGQMVAFSKTEDGYYNNLICWGINQAESAALMIIALEKENKLKIKTAGNNGYK